MTTVYLATAGAYSDFRVLNAFACREDAESYKLGEEVMEMEVREGPVEVRRWYTLRWRPERPDAKESHLTAGNPWWDGHELRDFDGDEKHAEHHWIDQSNIHVAQAHLTVGGWDLSLVKKVYNEQRAQYLARKEGIA